MLQLTDVSKTYGDQVVLKPTTLRFDAGRTYVLAGPSGSGKSTVLRIMIGLVTPDRGRVTFGDLALDKHLLEVRRSVGYVIQEGGLFPHLTAAANVMLMASYLGWDESRRNTRISKLAGLTHLSLDVLNRFPSQLSGGQRQRVSLMRALMLDPTVLLLDEPLGALDPMIRAELQDDLRDIFQTLNKTVVMVTHDIGEAAYLADEILLMRDGQVVQRGTFQQLSDEPADPFVTRFIQAQRFAPRGGSDE